MAALFELFRMSLKLDMRETFISKWNLPVFLISQFFWVSMFWFMSQAFGSRIPFLQDSGMDYFTFVMVAEFSLLLPAFLMSTFAETIKINASFGTLESILLARQAPAVAIIIMGLSSCSRQLLKVITNVGIALILFELSVSALGALQAFLLQLAALPLFLGIGLLSAAILVRFGQGAGLLGTLADGLILFAGAYFPIQVFPQIAQSVSAVSPFTVLLVETRAVVVSGVPWTELLDSVAVLLGWGMVVLPLGVFILVHNLEYYRRRTVPLLLR